MARQCTDTFVDHCRTVDTASTNPSTAINSIALMKGGSANLETAIPNILAAPVPVNPPSYAWNVPATVETGPSCK